MAVDPYLEDRQLAAPKEVVDLWKDSKVTWGPTNPGITTKPRLEENSLAVFKWWRAGSIRAWFRTPEKYKVIYDEVRKPEISGLMASLIPI